METDHVLLTNINTVKEMILDEDKLVTYITVSKDLSIHVNNSKKLLRSFINKIREEQPNIQLNINYIISGMRDDNCASTIICTENELDKLRKTFKIIFFDHVYSICKGFPSVDNAAFLILNKFEDFSLCIGLIKSDECDKRTFDEIGNLKSNSQEAILGSKPVIVANKSLKQQATHIASEVEVNEKVKENKSVKQVDAKTETIRDEILQKESTVNTPTNQKINGHKTQKGIASFFNNPNRVPNKKVLNNPKKNTLDGKTGKTIKIEEQKVNMVKDYTDSENFIKKDNPVVLQTINKEYQSDKESKIAKTAILEEKNKVQNKIIKSSKVDKKRKRVLHVPDSESDEEKDPFHDNLETNQESDDEIPSTPLSINTIKVTGFINPKKRRKVVDKTYTDENGYVLTKKEEVYESCSESEDAVKIETESKPAKEVKSNISPTTKKNSPPKAKKKTSPPLKGKQQTLNNFFQRK